VQIACDPVPLLDCPVVLTPFGLGELCGGALTLRDDRAEQERRQSCDQDEDLGAQRPEVDRLRGERTVFVCRHSDGHSRGDRNRKGRAGRPEPEGGPDQRREDEIRHRRRDGEREGSDPGDGGDHESALP
jgi:hypothetical protein